MKHLLLLLLLAAPVTAQTALYDAGVAGNPMAAPDPTTQGWTLDDPSGGMVGLSPLSPDPGTGRNAWVIDDQVTFNGGRAHYGQLFTPAELDNAEAAGWELSVEARFITTNGIDAFVEFASGNTASDSRYLTFFTTSGSDVVANVFLSGLAFTCVGGNDGMYHTYTIRKPAGGALEDASFSFDGVLLGSVPAESSNGNAPDGGVHWGSGSSGATATIHFHRVEFGPLGGGTIGSSYCTAVPNSAGSAGTISATGSTVAASNDVTLTASGLPRNQFGIFVTSMTTGFVPGAGGTSNGNLCLGGAIGRYIGPGQILSTGSIGEFSLDLDLAATPQGSGVTTITAGQSWAFQAWHRDGVGLGSNFTDGLIIDFQ